MGIFDLFKKKKSTNSYNIETTTSNSDKSIIENFSNIDLEDTGEILNNYIKGKSDSKHQYTNLQNKLREYEIQSKLERQYFNEYYSKFIKAKDLEKSSKIEEALKLYMDIIDNYNPEGNPYYERPAIMLEKNKDYKRALSIAILGKQNLINRSMNEESVDINYFDKRISRLKEKIKNPSKTSEVYKSKQNNIQPSELHTPKNTLTNNILSWNISISFGKSTSNNYSKAVFLAKQSSNYYEDGEGKDIIHQATYTPAINDYLTFIKLYELVGSWKSSFVFINGEITDRKIIGKLNYCYGDKCRSGNDKFCYGASQYTANPFGCHRLQVSEFNNPWWSFGIIDTKGIWHIDKNAIAQRINQHYIPYINCPSFSYDKVMFNLNNLPNIINPKKDKNWEVIGDKIYPKGHGVVSSITINLDNI